MKTKAVLVSVSVLWLFVIAGGLPQLMRYENTAGEQGITLSVWPEQSRTLQTADMTTLAMLAHPQCTRAGIEQTGAVDARN